MPIASLLAGMPNSSTAPIPSAATSSISGISWSMESWYTSGIESTSALTPRPCVTNMG